MTLIWEGPSREKKKGSLSELDTGGGAKLRGMWLVCTGVSEAKKIIEKKGGSLKGSRDSAKRGVWRLGGERPFPLAKGKSYRVGKKGGVNVKKKTHWGSMCGCDGDVEKRGGKKEIGWESDGCRGSQTVDFPRRGKKKKCLKRGGGGKAVAEGNRGAHGRTGARQGVFADTKGWHG